MRRWSTAVRAALGARFWTARCRTGAQLWAAGAWAGLGWGVRSVLTACSSGIASVEALLPRELVGFGSPEAHPHCNLPPKQ